LSSRMLLVDRPFFPRFLQPERRERERERERAVSPPALVKDEPLVADDKQRDTMWYE